MAENDNGDDFKLQIPLDASAIEDFKPDRPIKIVVQSSDGTVSSQTAKLDKRGHGEATFGFAKQPGALRIAVGPDDASDDELLGMQTINLDVAVRQWRDQRELTLQPIRITPYYWHFWLRWCRTFVIRGRVLCPDGSPVPGAQVCAYDVDFWWWWSSNQQVGCATTDATGSFEITFRWCCGWWPWWWWRRRSWYLDTSLAERIVPLLQRDFKLRRPLIPSPRPDLAIFDELLGDNDVLARGTKARPTFPTPGGLPRTRLERVAGRAEGETPSRAQRMFDPAVLDPLRERLKERLPIIPEFERLQLWPWWPWHPWWDCTPDIIFRVTQPCQGREAVVVNEGFWQTRWDIATELSVTLVANEQACCIPDIPPPEGNCMVIDAACGHLIDTIGGNPGAPVPVPGDPAVPVGYVIPGDRPFGGNVSIHGSFGTTSGAQYYEFEFFDDDSASWMPLPATAIGGYTRAFWGPPLAGPGAADIHYVPFPVVALSGHTVVQTRQHFEAANDPLSWGATRLWTGQEYDTLIYWLTGILDFPGGTLHFADGTYRLRVRSWDRVGDTLVNDRVLLLCDTQQENGIVLTLDNRLEGPSSGHPTSADHPCGGVHSCTTEPDTDIIAVRINGVPYQACDVVDAKAGGTLEIDLLAHDPDGHLASYTLQATYGENQSIDLLSPVDVPSGTLSPLAAAQTGPTYGDALAQGATAPLWEGGTYRLTITNLPEAFPVTCAYQLELRAYKRTIVNCSDSYAFQNLSEYSLTVLV